MTPDAATISEPAASYIWDIHTFKVAYQQSSGSTGYHYGGYQNEGRRRRWREHHLAGQLLLV